MSAEYRAKAEVGYLGTYYDQQGFGTTQADCDNMLQSILNLQMGTLTSYYIIRRVTRTMESNAGSGVPVYVVMSKADTEDRAIVLPQCSSEYLTASDQLDLTNTAVLQFQASFRDEDGQGGYTIFDSYRI